MAFDVDRLTGFCAEQIRQFAEDHADETFYAFAIDASLLCLNSKEAAAVHLEALQVRWARRTRAVGAWEELTDDDLAEEDFLLARHARRDGLDRSDRTACLVVINTSRARAREKGNPYEDPEAIRSLRENPGDWTYRAFAEMTEDEGFDEDAYGEHYDMDDEDQKNSAYGLAMDEVLERLNRLDAFSVLRRTEDFYATRVEHDY
jgi:hypothetical protein